MKKRHYATCSDLCDEMIDLAANGLRPMAVLFFDEAAWLLKELLQNDEIGIGCLEAAPKDYNDYDKEYYVYLNPDFTVEIVPAYYSTPEGKEGYLYGCSDVVFFGADVSSKTIAVNEGTSFEVDFCGIDDDDEEPCGDCCGDCNLCDEFDIYRVLNNDGIEVGITYIYKGCD